MNKPGSTQTVVSPTTNLQLQSKVIGEPDCNHPEIPIESVSKEL